MKRSLIEAKYHISSNKEYELNAKEISKNHEIAAERKKRVQLLYRQLFILNNSKLSCEKRASKYARNCIITLSIFLVLAYLFFGYILHKSDWNIIQWKLYYIESLIPLGLFLLAVFFDKEIKFNPIKINSSVIFKLPTLQYLSIGNKAVLFFCNSGLKLSLKIFFRSLFYYNTSI